MIGNPSRFGMNCWCTIISAHLLFFYTMVQGNLIIPTSIPMKDCLDCHNPLDKLLHLDLSMFSASIINNNVAIGAKHYLVVFSSNGEFKYKVQINSTAAAFAACKKTNHGKSELCPNIINLLIQDKGLIIACGTNSDRPHCWILNRTKIVKSFQAHEYYPSTRFVYTKTDSYLFTAYQDKNGKGRLYKVDMSSPAGFLKRRFSLKTSPHFVSLYEFGDYIYYFFNEFPEELRTSFEKVAISRVGRLCKHDTGGSGIYKDKMILFMKIRLLCEKSTSSSSEKLPFHYNYLEQTSFVKTEDGRVYIYGIFKSGPGSPVSAICRFSLSGIDKLFDSKTTKFFDIRYLDTDHPLSLLKPRFLKCNSSLNTKNIDTATALLSMASPLAASAVKADGNEPVIELHVTPKPYIISEYVPTNGEPGYHVIYVIGSNVMFIFAVPVKGAGTPHLISKTKISKNELKISDVKKVKDLIFVSAEKEVVVAPDASCHLYNSCRDCVEVRNPHCAWNNNLKKCTKYNPLQSSIYKQDIVNGDYSKVCEKENASCKLLRMQLPIPNREVELSCKFSGVPGITQIYWKKDGKFLSVGEKTTQGEARLVIKRYDILVAGKYTCHVTNDVTSGNCSVNVPGSEPKLKCSVSKQVFWSLSCNATGYPEPTVLFKVFDNSGRMVHSNFTATTTIVPHQSYQCFAYNSFGVASGNFHQMYSTTMTLKILEHGKSDCVKTKLKSKLEREVKKLYKNVEIFGDISNITFRYFPINNVECCVASIILSGLTSSSFQEIELTRPLKIAIENGSLGDLKVKAWSMVEPPIVIANTQSTDTQRKPLSTTTRPSNSSIPYSTQGGSDVKYSKGESSCTKVWKIVVPVIFAAVFCFLIGFALGCFCSRKEKTEGKMDSISRSKERESQRHLIDKNAEKHVSPKTRKQMNTDGKRSSEISKHDCPIEMKNSDENFEEDHRKSGHSEC